MARSIQPVNNNTDKARTYREMMQRYNRAVKEEFYFEALLIDYAMIEDRLLSFLYHCGVQNSRTTTGISGISKRKFIHVYLPAKGNGYSLTRIGDKISIARGILQWACTVDHTPEELYLKALKTQCESLDTDAFLEALNQIEEWKEYRNEVIHSVLNKNLESLSIQLPSKVEEGMKLGRFVDSQVRIIKKRGRIRKAAKLSLV